MTDYVKNDIIDFKFDSFAKSGSSIDLGVDGTIQVYKSNNATPDTAGVTFTEAFNGITGVHHVRINTSGVFYVSNEDYDVVLNGSTIDGQSVSGVLYHFTLGKSSAKNLATAANLTTLQNSVNNLDTDVANLNDLSTGDIASVLISQSITTLTNLQNELGKLKGATYDENTDSLEAIRDRGDAAWVTGGGGAAPSEADIWNYGTRTLTGGVTVTTNNDKTGYSLIVADINSIVSQITTAITNALTSDVVAEPGSIPAANAPISQKLSWLFMLVRNKLITNDSGLSTLYADNGTTPVATSQATEGASDVTRNEWS